MSLLCSGPSLQAPSQSRIAQHRPRGRRQVLLPVRPRPGPDFSRTVFPPASFFSQRGVIPSAALKPAVAALLGPTREASPLRMPTSLQGEKQSTGLEAHTGTRLRCRRPSPFRVSASASAASAPASQLAAAEELQSWLQAAGFPPLRDTLALAPSNSPQGVTLTAARKINQGDLILSIPENFCVTALDVANHPVLSSAAVPGGSDLALLALWLLWERSRGEDSAWLPYLATFSTPQPSPLLWSAEERGALLQGYSGVPVIEQRVAEIESLHAQYRDTLFLRQPDQFPAEAFSLNKFKEAFATVLARAVFLPGAEIFALLPVADFARHGPTSRAFFQYNPDTQSVVLVSDRTWQAGEEVRVSRGPELTSLDLALQTGEVFDSNPHDLVSYSASLVPADPLFALKKQLLQEEGFSEAQVFPLYSDRFPQQLLSYLRLARVQDSAQLARVTFKADVMVSESNEYEILMLVLGDCKERLVTYPQALEDDLRIVNGRARAPTLLLPLGGVKPEGVARAKALEEQKQRLAAQLRASEKRILSNTVTALRTRLAPIRGIPTKSGMGDPNSEIKEVFAVMEKGLSAPKRILGELFKDK